VVSTIGEGTTFYLMFPVASDHVVEADKTKVVENQAVQDDEQKHGDHGDAPDAVEIGESSGSC
jgi:hypothetical protein